MPAIAGEFHGVPGIVTVFTAVVRILRRPAFAGRVGALLSIIGHRVSSEPVRCNPTAYPSDLTSEAEKPFRTATSVHPFAGGSLSLYIRQFFNI
jgi:hypothetical protein